MLKQMRSGAHSIVLKFLLFGLLLLAFVGLALMDYRGMLSGNYQSSNVATIDGEKISSVEFEQLMQQALRRQKMSTEEAYKSGYPAQYLQNEINSRVLTKNVRDLGLIVSNEEAAKQLQVMLAPFTAQGLDKKTALQTMLYNMGISEGQLVESMKAQIGVETLMKSISTGIKAPPQMAQDALKYRAESRRAEYFTVTADEAGKAEQPDDKALEEYYKKISSRFMIPESRTLAVLVVDAKSLGLSKDPTEEERKAWYEEHKDSYKVGERRVIAQLVVPKKEDADKLLAEAKTAKNLEALSKGAGKGISTYVRSGEYTEAETPMGLADAFKAEKGAVVGPVETPLGFLIAQVEDIKPASVRAYDEVKSDVADAMSAANDSGEALMKRADEIEDLIAGGKSLDEIAQQMKLKLTTLEKVTQNDLAVTKLPAADQIFAEGFKLSKGTISQRLDAPTGEFVIVEVRDVFPAQEQPIAKVHADVLKAWNAEKKSALLDQATSKILDRLKMGEDFDTVAKSLGKKVSRTEMVRRDEHAKAAAMMKGMFPALFALDKIGQVTAIGTTADGATILRLADRRIDDAKEPKKEDLEQLRNMLDHAVQKDLLEQYRMSLLAKYKVKIDNKVLDRISKPRDENADDTGAN
ncbi:MAG: peptidyl-prolyl cis-trans isomerase [Alphaproteobacteria bacterium]|nr:peptidyl-prolyl cis-trans isomerase [Alphaproteobacteria bacterium]